MQAIRTELDSGEVWGRMVLIAVFTRFKMHFSRQFISADRGTLKF